MKNSLKKLSAFFYSSKVVRTLIVLFYLSILAIFLYLPKIKDCFNDGNVLRIYTFVDNFHPEVLKEFEHQFNVKIIVRYFDSNEELLAKFKITRGSGYDIVTPSDYMVELLRKENLLQELDHNSLPVIEEMDQRVMGLFFDPQNRYSLPLMWIPYGIVFKKDIFDKPPQEISLGLIFQDPQLVNPPLNQSYKICMVDDYREAMFFAFLYRYGSFQEFSAPRLEEIKRLLLAQKKWVESYINQDLRYYLLAGIVKVALAPSVFVKKILDQSTDYEFKIPVEGSAMSIENIAIPLGSKNAELAHKFINFILSKNASYKSCKRYGFNSTNRFAYSLINEESTNKNFFPDDQTFEKLYILNNNLPIKDFEEIWLIIKSY